MLPIHYLQVVRSCPGCSFCELLVALFPCQSSKRGIGEAASIIPMDISNCTLHPLVILSVDDSNMVPYIKHESGNAHPPRFGGREEVVRSPKCWPGSHTHIIFHAFFIYHTTLIFGD
jgi:hypothetical protein